MKIISWNVNGLRAILRKGLMKEMEKWEAKVVCLQETKINTPLLSFFGDYRDFWGLGERAGYAGTLTLVKESEEMARRKLPKFLDDEGRGVWLEGKNFHLLNIYFPNGGQGVERLKYKFRYYQEFLELVKELKKKKPVIFCGDVNTAHEEIDLARPKENSQNTGFLPEERAWLDQVVKAGMVDGWRKFHPKEVGYSWWDYKTRARERNVGWRIDYFFCSKELMGRVKKCELMTEVMGSDHAPVLLELDGDD